MAGNQVVLEDPAVNDRHLRRRDHLILLLRGGEVLAVHRNLPVFDHSVRCLDEAVRIDGGIGGQRDDQTDVRTLRRLNRADATVVGGMNVAHLEAGAFA